MLGYRPSHGCQQFAELALDYGHFEIALGGRPDLGSGPTVVTADRATTDRRVLARLAVLAGGVA